MNVSYKNGWIVANLKNYQKARYDIGNQKLFVRLNGKGSITKYVMSGEKVCYDSEWGSLNIYIDGEPLDYQLDKRVDMLGREQCLYMKNHKADVKVSTFVENEASCVFQKITVSSTSPAAVSATVCMMSIISGKVESGKDSFIMKDEKSGFSLAANCRIRSAEENQTAIFEPENSEEVIIKLVYAFNAPNVEKYIADFDLYEERKNREREEIYIPKSVKNEVELAQFYSSHYCALQTYKVVDDFCGFNGGVNYALPTRTYFRDAYFIVPAMYNGRTDWVRAEILTLARGVAEDDTCPSAVLTNFTSFWGNHYDSPSLFVMIIYDYVNNTKDFSVLNEKIGDRSLLELAQAVLKKLGENCDDTGLIYKAGKYNKRDWADEVNRYGYITYIEILYARANYCMAKLLSAVGVGDAALYENTFEAVKEVVNTMLWNDKENAYINFMNSDYVEDNISIDTILAVVFGFLNEEKSKKMLSTFIDKLESRNHNELEDFGVMCVYPIYKSMESAYRKSARPYDYHNGADWPYWSALYAYALKKYKMPYEYPLKKWFTYNCEKGNYTPIEYYSPYCDDGSLLQPWSSLAAFVYYDENTDFFENKI